MTLIHFSNKEDFIYTLNLVFGVTKNAKLK